MVAMRALVAFGMLLTGANAGQGWKEPQDWEEAVSHRRRRQDVRYYPQDAEAGFYQPYYGVEAPEFVAQYVPPHMYSAGHQKPQVAAVQQPIAAPPSYDKQYSVYPYQAPELFTNNMGRPGVAHTLA